MILKQIAIFIENELGRLVEITDFLSENGVNLHALSITDTTDYGILRIVVDDPESVAKLLKKNGFTVSLTDVVVAKIEDRPGGLSAVLRVLADEKIAVEYVYPFLSHYEEGAFVVVRTNNAEKTKALLEAKGFIGFRSAK